MKKLALAVATLFLAATPALACPDMESGHGDNKDTKTAEKDKAKDSKGQEKAKPAPKDTDKKTAKPEEKKPAAPKSNDKVSSK
jgi:hypothetical protein